ncbi:MAG: hypothetical protein HKN47_11730 [Pirellulaceae bacterium]|nr:hypothetical protein [Pirellulaceae bacterium]
MIGQCDTKTISPIAIADAQHTRNTAFCKVAAIIPLGNRWKPGGRLLPMTWSSEFGFAVYDRRRRPSGTHYATSCAAPMKHWQRGHTERSRLTTDSQRGQLRGLATGIVSTSGGDGSGGTSPRIRISPVSVSSSLACGTTTMAWHLGQGSDRPRKCKPALRR